MTKHQQFIETYTRIFSGVAEFNPRVALAQALTLPSVLSPLIKKGNRAASVNAIAGVRGMLLDGEVIANVVLYASKVGGFTGALFELLWLCEEPVEIKPALDPARKEMEPAERRAVFASDLREELGRISRANRAGRFATRVFTCGRHTTTAGYRALYALTSPTTTIASIRHEAHPDNFTPEFFRRLEECK